MRINAVRIPIPPSAAASTALHALRDDIVERVLEITNQRLFRAEISAGGTYPAVHFLVTDVPSVDVADAARVAGGAAGPVADASGDLLVGRYGADRLFGIAVGCECGEGEGDGGSEDGELHGECRIGMCEGGLMEMVVLRIEVHW